MLRTEEKSALIFANGEAAMPPDLADLLGRAGLIIAADGGAGHCARLGIVPHHLIGDLDSLEEEILQQLQHQGTLIHRHPPEKDATDLELALDLALDLGASETWLIGALGGRWDMSLANILLCAQEKYRPLRLSLAGSECRMHLIHAGSAYTIRPRPGSKVSLLPLRGDAHGITLEGFQYPLRDATLPFGTSRGISNVAKAAEATVHLREGMLLCICLDEE